MASKDKKTVVFPDELDIPVEGFAPDDRHFKYLRCVSTADSPLSLHKIAELIGVPVSTVHDWHQRPDFQEWIARNRERFLQGQIHQVYNAMLGKALDGSAPHIKMFLQRFDDDFVRAMSGKPKDEEEEISISDNQILLFLMKRCGVSKGVAAKLIAGKAKVVA